MEAAGTGVCAIIDPALILPLPIREVLLPPFCVPDHSVENMRMMDRGFKATLHLSARVWSERIRSLRQRLHVTALRQGIQNIGGDDMQAQTAGLVMVLTEIVGSYHPARPDPAFAPQPTQCEGSPTVFSKAAEGTAICTARDHHGQAEDYAAAKRAILP
jgi:hypothetical protein